MSNELKIFISYSRRDAAHLDSLRKHLVPLEQYASIRAWYDQRLSAGDNWKEEIFKALDECDIALLLVSPDFLASEFINRHELPRLLERHKQGHVQIVPIILRKCLWEIAPIKQFQALPRDGQQVISFPEDTGERDQVWTSIGEEIAEKARSSLVEGAPDAGTQPSHEPTVEIPPRHHAESRTCMFCEISGLDELRRQSSDQNTQQTAARFAALFEQLAADDSELVSVTDTRTLLAYRSPSRAIAASLALQRSAKKLAEEVGVAVNVRVGLHQGEVIIGESAKSGIVGRHVNCAAQVSQVGEDGQIIISSSVFDSAKGGDFGIPNEYIAWLALGEYYLSAVGNMELYEVADRRVRVPAAPDNKGVDGPVSARRFELTDYDLGERLGEEGSGVVYRATQRSDNRPVAIKVLAGGNQANEILLERFLREVEALSRLSHESVVNVISVHQETMPPFFVMDYIEGKPITDALKTADWDAVVDTLIMACAALDHAHKQGVLHADLQPDNILVDQTGKPTILGFGLCILLASDADEIADAASELSGTPLYLAPEQIDQAIPVDVRTDVYAFGVLMYEILTGSPPYSGTNQAVRDAHLNEVPTLPVIRKDTVPEVLQRICLKAIEKLQERRYSGIDELQSDLQRYRNGEPVHSRPSVYNNLIESPARKHVETIDSWHAKRLITDKEHVALKRPYRRLLHTGMQAVSESRLVHLDVMLHYLGAWLVLAGCALWISRAWTEGLLNYTAGRIAVAVFPALLTNTYWHLYYKRGAHRMAFVAMILGLLSLPFAVATLAHEAANAWNACWLMDNAIISGESVFPGSACVTQAVESSGTASAVPPTVELAAQPETYLDSFRISNVQAFLALSVAMAWSVFVARRSETITSSMVAGTQLVLLFVVMLDIAGLLDALFDSPKENIGDVGQLSMILSLALLLWGYIVSRQWGRSGQATPLFGLALAVGVFATQAIAAGVPFKYELEDDQLELAIGGLEVICGLLYLGAALFLYRRLRLESSAAHVVLLWLAPLAILGGVTYISFATENWNHMYWALLVFSVSTLLYSAYVQSYFYILCGLGFTALSLWQIEEKLLDESEWWWWPITIVLSGVALTLSMWFRDRLNRTLEDMDDVGERIIKMSLHNDPPQE